jgi:hypothetical protein
LTGHFHVPTGVSPVIFQACLCGNLNYAMDRPARPVI